MCSTSARNQRTSARKSFHTSCSYISSNSPASSWTRPHGKETGVRIWNSLTSSEVPLISTSATNTLSWYTCGPTVYDVSHLGHARTYVTVDIILRALREYFGVHAWHVLNVTDVDDKIIKRSNEAGVPALELSQKFEREFFRDLTALGVEPPSTVLRVSEHIDEVVQFIRKLESDGVAYATPSGVYFDTLRFSGSHSFKMAPVFEDGLEESGDEVGSRDKRNVRDFALWKAAKEGEPSWASPWGAGRPGWHIECSAMCSSLFGSHLDVHAGGIDLKFPHHCNEVAQCEAFHGSQQWGNYFIHVGHLHIAGLKMSKSLKNFVSIQDYLKKYTGRQFRIFCLLHGYGKPVDYSEEHMQHSVLPVEKRLDDFLALTYARMRQAGASRDVNNLKWGEAEKALQQDVLTCEHKVKESLARNIDTEDALTSVLDLVTRGHAYLQASSAPRTELLASLSRAVSRPLRVFGVLPQAGGEGGDGAAESKEAEILDTLARFRQQVRKTAISSANVKKDVLSLCDQLRDKDLPAVGFRLEDDPKAGSLWKRAPGGGGVQ